MTTYQVITGLENGTYALTAWVKGSDHKAARLQARNFGGAALAADIAASPNDWVLVSVPNINVQNGQCEIGVYSDAKAGQWLYF
ncbi:MAG: hypothetical protein WKG07_39405 [Hymenobacter sp.]